MKYIRYFFFVVFPSYRIVYCGHNILLLSKTYLKKLLCHCFFRAQSFPPQTLPHRKPSHFRPKTQSFCPKTQSFPPQTLPHRKPSHFRPKTQSFPPKNPVISAPDTTLSHRKPRLFRPKTQSFPPQTLPRRKPSHFRPKTQSFPPQTQHFRTENPVISAQKPSHFRPKTIPFISLCYTLSKIRFFQHCIFYSL